MLHSKCSDIGRLNSESGDFVSHNEIILGQLSLIFLSILLVTVTYCMDVGEMMAADGPVAFENIKSGSCYIYVQTNNESRLNSLFSRDICTKVPTDDSFACTCCLPLRLLIRPGMIT